MAEQPVSEISSVLGTEASSEHKDLTTNHEIAVDGGEAPPVTSIKSPVIKSTKGRAKKQSILAPLVTIVAALAIGVFVWLRGRKKRNGGSLTSKKGNNKLKEQSAPKEPAEVPEDDGLDVIVDQVSLDSTFKPLGQTIPVLKNVKVAVSEELDLLGTVTSPGMPLLTASAAPASISAPVVELLRASGATCTLKTGLQPFGIDLVGTNVGNPHNRLRIAGGGASGAAVVVASGETDIAVARDYLGQVCVPAAACGLYGYRSTPGCISLSAPRPGESSNASEGLETIGIFSNQLALLTKVGSSLRLPGNANLRGEIVKFIVAEDLFHFCAPELQPAVLALKKAVLRWAGNEQAGAVQLVAFLARHITTWTKVRDASPHPITENGAIPPFLECLYLAAATLQTADLQSRYLEQLQELSKAGEEDGASTPELPDEAKSLLSFNPSAELLAASREVARETAEVLRQTIKHDTLVILPVIPSAPPRRRSEPDVFMVFAKLSACFASLCTLGGCPLVTMPVGQLSDGAPLCVGMMALARQDQRLLAVAERMAPLLMECFQQTREELAQAVMKQAEGGSSDRNSTSAATPSTPAVDPKKLLKAEKYKAKGNEHFKAGKFVEAISEYTRAIGEDSNNPTYYSNRAMACLKTFRFEQAEEDCNKALKFDLKDADKVKALLRRGTARMGLHKLEEAEKDYKLVLAFEPNNRQARDELISLRQMQEEMREAQLRMAAQMRADNSAQPNGAHQGGHPQMPPNFLPPGMMPPGFLPPGMMDPSAYGDGYMGEDGQYMVGDEEGQQLMGGYGYQQ